MPSKLKKAIAAVKDQTSISLAMVKTSSLEVAILKATSHDDSPVSPQHLNDILRLVGSDGGHHASVCVRSLGRRAARTRSWMVALKSLLVVLRLLQSPNHAALFSRELMKTGYKILNLQDVPFSSPSSAAFVRSFAAFLNARLLTGTREEAAVLSPAALLERVPRLQGLLDRAMAVGPVRPNSKLVLSALHAVTRESFEVYREVSDGLAILLDGFFHLQHAWCVAAIEACVEASRQFEKLRRFHELCLSCGVGTESEYPNVRTIPRELIETLREFLQDQSSFPAGRRLAANDEEEHEEDPEMMSPVLSESDVRNYPTAIELLDHEEGVALMLGSAEDDYDDNDNNNNIESGWELALLQNADTSALGSTAEVDLNQYNNSNNPFLQDPTPLWVDFNDKAHIASPQVDPFLQATFQADADPAALSNPVSATVPTLTHHDQIVRSNNSSPPPTFKVDQQEEQSQNPFGTPLSISAVESSRGVPTTDHDPNVINQQQMWLQIQTRILAKHLN